MRVLGGAASAAAAGANATVSFVSPTVDAAYNAGVEWWRTILFVYVCIQLLVCLWAVVRIFVRFKPVRVPAIIARYVCVLFPVRTAISCPSALVKKGDFSWHMSARGVIVRDGNNYSTRRLYGVPAPVYIFRVMGLGMYICPVVEDASGRERGLTKYVTYSVVSVGLLPSHADSGVHVVDDMAVLYHADTDMLEIVRLDSPYPFTVPMKYYWAAKERYKMATSRNYGIVAVAMQPAGVESPELAACMKLIKSDTFSAYWSPEGKPDVSYSQLYSNIPVDDDKPMPVVVVSSVVYNGGGHGQGMANIGRSAETYTVEARIIAPASAEVGNPEMWGYAEEFLKYVCKSKLIPVDLDRVAEQMDRPSQKANREAIWSVLDILPDLVKSAFTKREAVDIGKPARNICTVSPQRLTRASQFSIAMADYMESFPWWVWGVGSGATARLYHKTCARHSQMMESDFSKFDASLGPFFAAFNLLFVLRLFGAEHASEITDLQKDAMCQTVRTACGILFAYGLGRMSGVNETTLFNTVDQAFIQFVSFRKFGYPAEEAIAILEQCLFGGDDGIVPFLGQDLPAAAAVFGMKVTYRVFNSNTPCRFLGRVYVNGADSPDSIIDLASFFAGLHLAFKSNGASDEQCLVNAATGYFVTDGNNPVVRDFCMSVFRAYPRLTRTVSEHERWWVTHYLKSDPFPCDGIDEDTIIPWFATTMGVAAEDIYALRDWFANNKFFVGSVLPTIEIQFAPSIKGAYMAFGLPFNRLETAPELPKYTPRSRARQMESVVIAMDGIAAQSARRESVASVSGNTVVTVHTAASVRLCYRCGQAGHEAKACKVALCGGCGADSHVLRKCPNQKCKSCGGPHHIRDCTEKEEQKLDAQADEAARLMGLLPDVVVRVPVAKEAKGIKPSRFAKKAAKGYKPA